MGIPWPGINLPILGVVPVLFLMFFVRPAAQSGRSDRNACSRCASPHSVGQNYCTKCGWDLSREYSPENNDTVLASEIHQAQASSTATIERPADPPTPEVVATPAAEPEQAYVPHVAEDAPQDSVSAQPEAPTTVGEPEDSASQEPDPEPVQEPEPAPDAAQRPWGIPVPGPAPTAEGMTARGAVLLSEGKLQEAIDQFTKAIALDPRHREAFERRAQAYSKQGREDRAEEDLQRLQTLNAGS